MSAVEDHINEMKNAQAATQAAQSSMPSKQAVVQSLRAQINTEIPRALARLQEKNFPDANLDHAKKGKARLRWDVPCGLSRYKGDTRDIPLVAGLYSDGAIGIPGGMLFEDDAGDEPGNLRILLRELQQLGT